MPLPWAAEYVPKFTFHGFRYLQIDGWQFDRIPPEELANAMYEVLVDFHSCEPDTLYRETVKLFGFSAVTAKARKYLDAGFQALKQSGRI